MFLKLSSKALANKMGAISFLTTNKGVVPILDYFLLEVKEDTGGWILNIRATDLEVTMNMSLNIPSTPEMKESSLCVSSDILSLLTKLGDREVTLSNSEEKPSVIKVIYEGGMAEVPCVPAEDFPTIKKHDGEEELCYTMECADVSDALSIAIRFAGKDMLRPMLFGVNLHIQEDGSVRFVSSDSFRLACVEKTLCDKSETPEQWIIPTKGAMAMRNMAMKSSNRCFIWKFPNHMLLNTDDCWAYITLSTYKFPPYNSILVGLNTGGATVDRKLLSEACSRVMLSSKANIPSILIRMKDGAIMVSTDDKDRGVRANEQVEAAYNERESFILVNANSMIEALNSLHDVDVNVIITEESKPLVIEGFDTKLLIMPIK